MYSNIQKWGNSQGIRIPKAILETALFKENELVQIIAGKNQITIKKAAKSNHTPLKDRIETYYGKPLDEITPEKYSVEEIDWGKPMGKEVW